MSAPFYRGNFSFSKANRDTGDDGTPGTYLFVPFVVEVN